MDIDVFNGNLLDLHRQVASKTGRIELRTMDGAITVLISKTELDALEQALAIMSKTEELRAVKEQLSRIAGLSGEQVPLPRVQSAARRDFIH